MLISFLRILFFSLLTVYTLKIIKRKFSNKYFSIGQIIQPESTDLCISGLFLTFSPPFFYSFLICNIVKSRKFEEVLIYSIITFLLLIWPSVIYPMEVLSSDIYAKRKTLYFLYFMLGLIYIFISVAAYNFYLLIWNTRLAENLQLFGFLNFYNGLNPLYQNVLANIIAAPLISVEIYIYTRIAKKLTNNT
ncbi:hypothetical protein SDC9_122853 [bioreactor metagenome]|uniref:Uncharacterized protein n=1 Tax=bioreactor metagenome TaxID=1076179 RepID=A0A645CFT8_9ZZZZ